MGARRMRLRRVVERIFSGVKRVGMGFVGVASWGMLPGEVRCCGVKYSRPGAPVFRSFGAIAVAGEGGAGLRRKQKRRKRSTCTRALGLEKDTLRERTICNKLRE